jgi:hypothetical protein
MAQNIDAQVEALLKAPLGCAFLLVIDESRLRPSAAAQPEMSLRAVAEAIAQTEIWRTDHHERILEILRRGRRLRDLARAVLEEPGAGWWFQPINLEQQLWAWPQNWGSGPDPSRIRSRDESPAWLERYEQKPHTVWTSTLIDGTACLLETIDGGAGDWDVRDYPIACWKMTANAAARVYEIAGPEDWHALCLQYPVEVGGKAALHLEKTWPGEDRLTPDWQAFAKDWDGVHLSLGGLLTAAQVVNRTPEGWSVQWGWECELTVWLRWVFEATERLPEHERRIDWSLLSFPLIR